MKIYCSECDNDKFNVFLNEEINLVQYLNTVKYKVCCSNPECDTEIIISSITGPSSMKGE
jgi:hypothetical protein